MINYSVLGAVNPEQSVFLGSVTYYTEVVLQYLVYINYCEVQY